MFFDDCPNCSDPNSTGCLTDIGIIFKRKHKLLFITSSYTVFNICLFFADMSFIERRRAKFAARWHPIHPERFLRIAMKKLHKGINHHPLHDIGMTPHNRNGGPKWRGSQYQETLGLNEVVRLRLRKTSHQSQLGTLLN